jgi:hypothetical protein
LKFAVLWGISLPLKSILQIIAQNVGGGGGGGALCVKMIN